MDGDLWTKLALLLVWTSCSHRPCHCHVNLDRGVDYPSSFLKDHLLKVVRTGASSSGRQVQKERIPAWLQAIKLDRDHDDLNTSTLLLRLTFAYLAPSA